MDELSQLDELAESDILDALGKDSIKNEEQIIMPNVEDKISSENISVDANLSKNDLATLINELLSNKTLEITIKIKD